MAPTPTTTALPHTSAGSGEPPMVLVHGFGGDQLAWAMLMPELAKLRRTVALDLPGHGQAVAWPGP
ncbi:MAG: alpha/beta fold hydrolase, partial [Pseudomonadota bacterium]